MSDEDTIWRERFERERAARLEVEAALARKSDELRAIADAQDTAIAEAQERIRKLSLVARHTTNGVVITDAAGHVDWVNDGFTRITGYTLAEVRGHKPGAILQGPETDPTAVARLREAVRRREQCSVEILNYAKSGRPYWVSVTLNPIFAPCGALDRFIAVQADVTFQRQTRERLEYSEQRFRDIVEAAGEYVWEVDLEGRFCYLSRFAEEVLGRPRRELLGHLPAEFSPADERADLARLVSDSLRQPQPFRHLEHRTVRGDGVVIWQRVSGLPVRDAQGRFGGYRGTARDVTAEKETQHKLVAESDFARTVMESMGQGLTVTQRDGRLRFANHHFLEMLGYSFAELQDKTPFDWTAPAHHEALLQSREQRLRGERSTYESSLIAADGEQIDVLITGVPILDEGAYEGSITVVTDLRRRIQMERCLREAKDRAEQLNRRLQTEIERSRTLAREAESANHAKSHFLANMSHELRTPLNAILGLTESLLAGSLGPLEPRQGDALQIVERSGRHLLELISDVLDLAKIEAGKLDLAHRPTELPPLARACLEMMTPLARAKRLDLRAEVPDDLPPCRFDERRIRQILLNLLSNAIKFTPEGGSVLFRAALQPDPTDPARAILCLSVRDSGIGIAPEDQARLFQPFSQIDSQYARAHEGTGLGLTLVRRLAELHGGSVELESAAGAGSTFRVLLPQSGVTIPAHTAAAAPPVPPRGSLPDSTTAGAPRTDRPVESGPCRILYAEDNEANI
ncbi:MAG: PAS domain S-box protein, partial [Opitutales bacterium]